MTPLQLQAYDFIRDMLAEGGVSPTLSMLQDRFGLASRSGAWRLVDALVAQGRLVRTAAKTHKLALPGDLAEPDLTLVPTSRIHAELERRGAPPRPRRIVHHAPTRPCASAGCPERVQRGRLFCSAHWRALPQGLRTELVETFRAGREGAYEDAFRRATDYLATRAAA
jgi:hypothetical protein